jgi:superfamily II DNA helicase RecQ
LNSWYRSREGTIGRWVIDEAHQILTSGDYRHQFSRLKRLASFPVQKIFLTATLPPILQEAFLEETCLPSSTLWIRASTSRPNLRYHSFSVDNLVKHVMKVTVGLVQHLNQNLFTPASRGIVFCTSIQAVEKLAKDLHCAYSHSKMDGSMRSLQQDLWFTGSAQWIVASPGFLHGIDHPSVEAVIFVGVPYGLLNIEQGAGRAGRSGQPANIFILANPSEFYLSEEKDQSDLECRMEGRSWALQDTGCRRSAMTRVMDGLGVTCAEVDGALACDLCEPGTDIIQVIKTLMTPDIADHTTVEDQQNPLTTPIGQPALISQNDTEHDEYFDHWDSDFEKQVDIALAGKFNFSSF